MYKCDKCNKEISIDSVEGVDYYYYKENDSLFCIKCGDYLDAMSNDFEGYNNGE